MVKVHFMTYGCPTNFSESEAMMAILAKSGFGIAESAEDAFVIVINICTVKGNTASLREIRKTAGKYPHKKIIVAGCITNDIIPEIRKLSKDASLISTHNIAEIVQVVEETINDNPVEDVAKPESPAIKVSLPKLRKSSVAIVPICSGCAGSCTYCSVRAVKGNLFSYPMEAIVEEARKSVAAGCSQVWVTSQDTAAYMLDKGEKTMLPELIRKITALPGDFMVRIGMMNVNNLYPALGEMIDAMKDRKVFKFLHIPVQSGSDNILGKMGRGYDANKFRDAIRQIRAAIPEMTISTDIITGFPGETKEDFQQSLRLIDEIKPDVLNVSKFRKRAGTAAAEMDGEIPGDVAKDRGKHITSAFDWNAYLLNKRWLGWEGEIIIESEGKPGTNTSIARNYAYKQVIVDGNHAPGKRMRARIIGYSKHDLRGEIV